MRILLTGASSFTGSWFARVLADAGHHVTAVFRGMPDQYQEGRGDRVQSLQGKVESVWGVEFGDTRFVDIVTSQSFDILCHHAAEVTDYRSWNYDPLRATASNTRLARAVLTRMAALGCCRVVLTGSVFEPYEGVGDIQRRAFNPYGLSKHLTFEVFRMEAERLGLSLAKFVIPNPFGPLEEMRFTSYLAREWLAGKTPTVGTPVYVRDNIHVSLLARVYLDFCEHLSEQAGLYRATPSGYIESQGVFAQRMAREMSSRLGHSCDVILADQKDFAEPLFRTNSTPAFRTHPGWSEKGAWDDLIDYYKRVLTC